jgi:hypothetical protein
MRHFTLDYLKGLVNKQLMAGKMAPNRRPLQMPGKNWPTRVAWTLHAAGIRADSNSPAGFNYHSHRRLSYVGKPSRYRALEAHKFMERAQKDGLRIVETYEMEFDRDGLLAYVYKCQGHNPTADSCGAFSAYHPHSASPEVIGAFIKPLYLKYVGGQRLYSLKKRLQAEALDAYYVWYYQQFHKRLKRPKAQATAIIAGKPMAPESPKAPMPGAPDDLDAGLALDLSQDTDLGLETDMDLDNSGF